MEEVVDSDQLQRETRLSELQKIHAEKEVEVRNKREQLKRELENVGAAEDETMKARVQLAVSIYTEFQREFQRMKSEHRMLVGKLAEAKKTYGELQDVEIPEADVVLLLNNNPVYRDLKSRIAMLAGIDRIHNIAAAPGTKEPAGFGRTKAELEAAKAQLQELEDHSRDLVRGAKRIALKAEISHLESQVDIAAGQIAAFEKEVEKKANEADAVGQEFDHRTNGEGRRGKHRTGPANVAEEQERLRVELRSRPRVTVLGGHPKKAADVPESETRGGIRLMFIFGGSLLAMFVPAVGIVVWDLRKERVNCANDVSKRLRIPVIGAVPMIPATIMRRLGDSTRKSQVWNCGLRNRSTA